MLIKAIVKITINCDGYRYDNLRLVIKYKNKDDFFYTKFKYLIEKYAYVGCYDKFLRNVDAFISNKEEVIKLAKKEIIKHMATVLEKEKESAIEDKILKNIKKKIKFEFYIK